MCAMRCCASEIPEAVQILGPSKVLFRQHIPTCLCLISSISLATSLAFQGTQVLRKTLLDAFICTEVCVFFLLSWPPEGNRLEKWALCRGCGIPRPLLSGLHSTSRGEGGPSM